MKIEEIADKDNSMLSLAAIKTYSFYESLKATGFNYEQALVILVAFITANSKES